MLKQLSKTPFIILISSYTLSHCEPSTPLPPSLTVPQLIFASVPTLMKRSKAWPGFTYPRPLMGSQCIDFSSGLLNQQNRMLRVGSHNQYQLENNEPKLLVKSPPPLPLGYGCGHCSERKLKAFTIQQVQTCRNGKKVTKS